MQRRNVDFPEPEGPMRQLTSHSRTSIDTPLMTSSRPKCLCTPSALTIASSTSAPGRCVPEREDVSAQPLEGCVRHQARAAAAVVPLEVVLADGQHGGEGEVPDTRDDEQRDHLV